MRDLMKRSKYYSKCEKLEDTHRTQTGSERDLHENSRNVSTAIFWREALAHRGSMNILHWHPRQRLVHHGIPNVGKPSLPSRFPLLFVHPKAPGVNTVPAALQKTQCTFYTSVTRAIASQLSAFESTSSGSRPAMA